MYLIAGLGNPGAKYVHTRHNIGFIVLDFLVEKMGMKFTDSKWRAQTCRARLQGDQVVFVKPETFMNESGLALGQISSYFKIPPENILVIHDELDLSPGHMKMVCNRGAAGHKGITSIISHLGSKDFIRLRIGVGRPDKAGMEVSNFVLGKLLNEEQSDIETLYSDIEHGIKLFVNHGEQVAMNFLNATK